MNSKRPPNIKSESAVETIPVKKTLEQEADSLSAFYSYQIKNADGTLVEDSGQRKCKSFVKQFMQILFDTEFYASSGSRVTITDTSGTARGSALNEVYRALRTDAAINIDTYGLQVGTGTTAESISDNKLVTQVSHGTGAGQLQYGVMSYGAPSTTATTTTFRFTRVFSNASGGTVTVQEIGLVSSSNNSNRFLLLRDLTGAVAINNGQSLTLNVDFTTTI